MIYPYLKSILYKVYAMISILYKLLICNEIINIECKLLKLIFPTNHIMLKPANWKQCFSLLPCKRCPDTPFEAQVRWLISTREIAPFLELKKESVLCAYLDYGMDEGFYSVWNGVTSVLRWLLEFRSHDDNTVDDRAIITLEATDRDC